MNRSYANINFNHKSSFLIDGSPTTGAAALNKPLLNDSFTAHLQSKPNDLFIPSNKNYHTNINTSPYDVP